MLSPIALRSTLLVALATVAATAIPQTVVHAASTLKALPDTQVAAVASSHLLGRVAKTQTLYATVSLQLRDPDGLQAYANAVSDPRSPEYRQYLSSQEIGVRFGATPADRQLVASYLASKGLAVTKITENGSAVMVKGTASAFEAAFNTTLANYLGTDANGKALAFRANATTLQTSVAVAAKILTVSGLDTSNVPEPRLSTTLTPAQTTGLYSLQPTFTAGYHGEGRNVAISNFVGLRLYSAALFAQNYALPTPITNPGTTSALPSNVAIQVVNSSPANTGTENGEGDLDVQMVLGQAPTANVRVYDNGSNDLLSVLTQEASDNWADVITESYGWRGNAAFYTAAHLQHLIMTTQGQTYMAASGDSGTTISSYPYPNFDPDVLMIGGTTANVDSTTGARSAETAWKGGGGGWVTLDTTATVNNTTYPNFNVLPPYQQTASFLSQGVFGGATVPNYRLSPDISFHAAGSNGSAGAYFFYYRGSRNSGSIGTSFACPVFAGMLTTAEQRLFAQGGTGVTSNGRTRLGRLQDLIYSQAGRSDVYFDIVSGTNGALPSGATSNAVAGWDYTTGWGTLSIDAFVYRLLPAPIANLSVTLGNYVGDVTTVPVTVEFRTPGTTTVIASQTVYPDVNGALSVTAPDGGTYDVGVKASHWLRRTLASQTFVRGATTALPVMALVNGDVNGDNAVSAGDLAQIKVALGTQIGDSGYNASADLNGDGSVSAADLSIAIVRLGQVGDN